MYYYPAHYEPRYYSPYDYFHYYHSPDYYYNKYGITPRSVVSRYYIGSPYISSYSDGRFELLHRTPFYSSVGNHSDEEDRFATRFSRAVSVPRFARESSIPPRSSRAGSVPLEENLRHSTRASSVPPENTRVSFQPKIVHYSPNMVDRSTPSTTYTYQSRVPVAPEDKPGPSKLTSANPVSFGPRIYTNLSVFPTNRHSSYSLLTPIDRYKYRTSTIPTKVYGGMGPSMSYHSYPTPTGSTSSAYRQSDHYPTRFQINRITSPTMDSFYAGRRTLY